MIFLNARSKVRRAIWNENGLGIAQRSLMAGRCLTAITVTNGAEDGYAPPLETFDELAHSLSGVFRGKLCWVTHKG